MNIETKVLAGFALLGILIASSAIFLAHSASERLTRIALVHGDALSMVQHMQSASMTAAEESFAYLLSGQEIEKREYLEWDDTFAAKLSKFVNFTSLNNMEAEGEKKLVTQLLVTQKKLSNAARAAFSEYEAKGSIALKTFNKYESLIDELDADFASLYANEKEESLIGRSSIFEEIREQRIKAYIYGASTVIFCFVLGFFLYNHIRNEKRLRAKNERLLQEIKIEQESERKVAAAQIIQTSKLATLGEMATSVAHELNQPLNVIRMAAGNSRRKISKGTADPEYLNDRLERIEEQTARAAVIIDHMRMFGRKASEDPTPVDPREVVTNALDLMGEQLRLDGIEVVTELTEDCPAVLGHIIQLEQVILNLLSNARDAIDERDGEAKITLRVWADDNVAHITAEDTGGGIPEDVLPRIFEPFYTSKAMGKGTGLGLSVSYGIIHDMKGTIEADNIEEGTRFTISLPAHAHLS
jgi:signal transduction histidine kinase